MKKWLMGALLAATAGVPAMAQDANEARQRRGGGERSELRAERQQQRAERQAARQAAGRPERVEVAQPQPQVQPRAERRAARQEQRVERREDRNGDGIVRLDRNNPSYDPARGDRPERLNERRQDRREVRQEIRADRRDDRRDDRVERREDRQEYRADRRDDRRDDRARNGFNTGWNGRDGWNGRNDRYGWTDRNRGNWNRDWRRDGRYDWNRYRTGNRSAYRLPRYYAPYGWNNGYRRFSIGVSLSSVLWGQNYWIDDPFSYRLPEAYGPYRWVRYYNDALLVDIRSGQVVDVVHDIFY